jgi:hypothetical protein
MADNVKLNIVLQMRLQCVGCGHKEDLRLNALDAAAPEDWLRCPNCGPLEQINEPGEPASKAAERRNFRRGGVVVRGRPTNG